MGVITAEHGLTNGMILVCNQYQYSYSYRPKVIVLDASTVLIEGDRYSASITTGKLVETHVVSSEFDGCDYGKFISFDNGLIFECRTYHYHYAYRPSVLITFIGGSYSVAIDDEKYDGTLHRR